MKIKNSRPLKINMERRLHLPVIIMDVCPKCGNERTLDFSTNHLSNIETNNPHEIVFLCQHCSYEWSKMVILRITLEEVKSAWKDLHKYNKKNICEHCGHSKVYAERFQKDCVT